MEDDDLSDFLDKQAKIEKESCMNVAAYVDDTTKFADGKFTNIIHFLLSRCRCCLRIQKKS